MGVARNVGTTGRPIEENAQLASRPADRGSMTLNRAARRRRTALLRTRQPTVDPELGQFRSFTVGGRTIGSLVMSLDGSPADLAPDHDCPYCRALATLEEYEAAGDRATPELEQRANEAFALLSFEETTH